MVLKGTRLNRQNVYKKLYSKMKFAFTTVCSLAKPVITPGLKALAISA